MYAYREVHDDGHRTPTHAANVHGDAPPYRLANGARNRG